MLKTRMHEILGVEPGVAFYLKGMDGIFCVSSDGTMEKRNWKTFFPTADGWDLADAREVTAAINCGIIRTVPYTPDQKKAMKEYANNAVTEIKTQVKDLSIDMFNNIRKVLIDCLDAAGVE